MKKSLLDQHSIYKIISGSMSYGLETEGSDRDEKAIVLLPANYTLTLTKEWETETFHNPDIEYHSLKKVMNLLNSQNPTMLETLFVPDRFILKQTEHGILLREQRNLFLSQNCYYAFGGYAKDQLMRIKNGLEKATKSDYTEHLRYTLERMLKEMNKKYSSLSSGDFRIEDVYYENDDKQQVDVLINYRKVPLTQLNGIVSELASSLKSYNKINHRNKKPKDKLAKHAMHLFRLLLMGIEVLETGEITVFRKKDREFLLAIRNENYTWMELFELTDDLFNQLEKAKQNSVLPQKTNQPKINQLYFEIMSNCYRMS